MNSAIEAIREELQRAEQALPRIIAARQKAQMIADIAGEKIGTVTVDSEDLSGTLDEFADTGRLAQDCIDNLLTAFRGGLLRKEFGGHPVPPLRDDNGQFASRRNRAQSAEPSPPFSGSANAAASGDFITAAQLAERMIAIAAECERLSEDASRWHDALDNEDSAKASAGRVELIDAMVRLADHVALQWSVIQGEGERDE